jgi:hypothetical protein
VVLSDLQGKGHERKEASLLKPFWLRFSLLFIFIGAQDGCAVCGDKSDWTSRGQERVYAIHIF